MKVQNAELYLKEATACSRLQPLAVRFPELASKLEKLDRSLWFYSEYKRGYQSNISTDHSSGER